MKSLTLAFCFILLTSCLMAQKPERLFNDPTFEDCLNVYNDGKHEIVDGVVEVVSKKNFFLATKKRYKDFILIYEVKMPDTKEYSNSGMIFRGQVKGKSIIGYQAEVDVSDRAWSGGLYDQGRRQWLYPKHNRRSNRDKDFEKTIEPEWSEEKKKVYKHLEWNKYKIVCKGSEIKIFLNGTLMTHVIDHKDKEGHIALQHHGSKEYAKKGETDNIVRFRNIKIKELSIK